MHTDGPALLWIWLLDFQFCENKIGWILFLDSESQGSKPQEEGSTFQWRPPDGLAFRHRSPQPNSSSVFFIHGTHVQSLSRVQHFATPWTIARQAPLPMAKILEWVAISSCKGSSQPRDQTHVSYRSCTAGRFFTTDSLGKPCYLWNHA